MALKKQTVALLLYAGLYIPILGTALFWSRLSFRICALTVMGEVFILAVFNLLNFAFSGAGIHLLLTMCVLCTVLFGMKAGMLSMAIGVLPIAVAGFYFSTGTLVLDVDLNHISGLGVSWITAGIVFLLLSGTCVISPGMLQSNLERFIRLVKSQEDRLEKSNAELLKEIDEREKARTALKESEERFRLLFEAVPEAFYLQEKSGRIIDCNREAEKLFGYGKDEILGKTVMELRLVPEEELQNVRNMAEENRKGLATEAMELRLRKRDGTRITVQAQSLPIRTQGEILTLLIARDITDRKLAEEQKKEMEEQVRQIQKREAIGTLAGGIAHDFNNILSGIFGYAELSLIKKQYDAQTEDYIKEIISASRRARDLVRQILTFSRQADQELRPIKLKPILKEVVKLLRSALPSTIEIREIFESEPLILGDPTQIHQIVMNLGTNAGHAMRERGGTLSVTLRGLRLNGDRKDNLPDLAPGHYALLTVEDTGRGMDRHIREKMTLTSPQRRKGKGQDWALPSPSA